MDLRSRANVERALKAPFYLFARDVFLVFFYRKRGARNAG